MNKYFDYFGELSKQGVYQSLSKICKKNKIEISKVDFSIKTKKSKEKQDLAIHDNDKTYKIHVRSRSVKNSVNWDNISWSVENNELKKSNIDEDHYICGALIFEENNDYFAHCLFLTGLQMLNAQKNELFGPVNEKGTSSRKALYYDKIPDNIRSVGFKNTVLNSEIKNIELFEKLKLC